MNMKEIGAVSGAVGDAASGAYAGNRISRELARK